MNRTGTGTGTGTSGQAGSSGRAEERAHHSGKIGANVEIGAIRAGRILQAGPGKGMSLVLKKHQWDGHWLGENLITKRNLL